MVAAPKTWAIDINEKGSSTLRRIRACCSSLHRAIDAAKVFVAASRSAFGSQSNVDTSASFNVEMHGQPSSVTDERRLLRQYLDANRRPPEPCGYLDGSAAADEGIDH